MTRIELCDKLGLLTDEQVAELFKLTPSTLLQWGKNGKGPLRFTVGTASFYRLSDVEQYTHEMRLDRGKLLALRAEERAEPTTGGAAAELD